jgi:hypothetical protein
MFQTTNQLSTVLECPTETLVDVDITWCIQCIMMVCY